MNTEERIITIFTPTNNRVITIPELFTLLSKRTCKNWEWIINDQENDKMLGGVTATCQDARLHNFQTYTMVVAEQLQYKEISLLRRL